MTDRCYRAETTAMALVGAAHYGTRADVARILRGADLPALVIWLAAAVDPTKSPDELQSWTDPDIAPPRKVIRNPNGGCGVPSWAASYERHRKAGEPCDTCKAQMPEHWKRRRADARARANDLKESA